MFAFFLSVLWFLLDKYLAEKWNGRDDTTKSRGQLGTPKGLVSRPLVRVELRSHE